MCIRRVGRSMRGHGNSIRLSPRSQATQSPSGVQGRDYGRDGVPRRTAVERRQAQDGHGHARRADRHERVHRRSQLSCGVTSPVRSGYAEIATSDIRVSDKYGGVNERALRRTWGASQWRGDVPSVADGVTGPHGAVPAGSGLGPLLAGAPAGSFCFLGAGLIAFSLLPLLDSVANPRDVVSAPAVGGVLLGALVLYTGFVWRR